MKIDGNYLKFIRSPKPTNKFNSLFGEIKPGSLYRPTCVYALWKIETLIELLREEENAWEFERFGSVRSDNYPGFYVVYKDFFNMINTVVQGKWVPKEKRIIESLRNNIDNSRETLSFFESVKLKINLFYLKFFTYILPWQYQRKIIFNIKGYARKYNNSNL